MAVTKPRKIEIQNVLSPKHIVRVDADKYEAMKRAFLKVLPKKPPGLTAAEIGAVIGSAATSNPIARTVTKAANAVRFIANPFRLAEERGD